MTTPTTKPKPKRRKSNGLNPRQAAFCVEYLSDANPRLAAKRAGYSDGMARIASVRMLGNPAIADRIKKLQGARMNRLNLTQDDVIRRLLREIDAPNTDDDDRDTCQSARVAAIGLLGRHLGMFTNKVEFVLPRARVDAIRAALRGLPGPAREAVLRALTGDLPGVGPGPVPGVGDGGGIPVGGGGDGGTVAYLPGPGEGTDGAGRSSDASDVSDGWDDGDDA